MFREKRRLFEGKAVVSLLTISTSALSINQNHKLTNGYILKSKSNYDHIWVSRMHPKNVRIETSLNYSFLFSIKLGLIWVHNQGTCDGMYFSSAFFCLSLPEINDGWAGSFVALSLHSVKPSNHVLCHPCHPHPPKWSGLLVIIFRANIRKKGKAMELSDTGTLACTHTRKHKHANTHTHTLLYTHKRSENGAKMESNLPTITSKVEIQMHK